MNSQLETNFRRIERVSLLFRGVCTGLMVLVAIFAVIATAAALSGRLTHITSFGQTIPLDELSSSSRFLVGVVLALTATVVVKALYHLRRLLGNYARREIFTSDSTRQIRHFGITCVLWGLARIIWAFLPSMILAHAPSAVSITVDAVAIGAVIIAISWIAEVATSLREENDLTI